MERRVDRTAPQLAVTGGLADAAGSELDAVRALHVDANDAVSGVVRAEVLLDGERRELYQQDCPDGGCELQRDWTLLADGLSDGTHTVAVVAIDAAGAHAPRDRVRVASQRDARKHRSST